MCFDALRLNAYPWNHKRVYRVYKAMGLNLPRRKKRRLPDRARQPLDAPEIVNNIWSLDFMSDALYCGKRFRTLNVLDDGVREVLNMVVDTSIPGNWIRMYNEERPHRSLGRIPPSRFRRRLETAGTSSYELSS